MDNRSVDLVFVIPFRNEERYLAATLEVLSKQEMGDFSAEILLVDGLSTDKSRQIAERFMRENKAKNLLFSLKENSAIKTPMAFNIGITQTTAPIIGFGGAHTTYPSGYIRAALKLLQSVDADVVGGGHDKIISLDQDIVSQSVSCLYLSPMGAGVAAYHRMKSPGYVDTVYGGFYRREVFERIGLFNESLARNQDNELNARVVKAGFKIYFHPSLSTTYIQKTDLPLFLARAYNFGFYHPATWRENPDSFRLRHFAPAAWVLYLVGLIATWFFVPQLPIWTTTPLALYVILLCLSGIRFMLTKSFLVGLVTIPLFAIYHILYGLGIFIGSFDAMISLFWKRNKTDESPR